MLNSNPSRGMRDFLPSEKLHRERVLQRIKSTFLRYGFAEIEAPILESLESLLGEQGGENEKMIYKVLRRGLQSDDLTAMTEADELCDLGLRYDLTLPMARLYANHRGTLPDVFRCIQIGPVWRAERPQKGRYRQFTQCDIDIVGESSVLAEIELISTTLRALSELGLTELELKINDRRLLQALLSHVSAEPSDWSQILIAIDKNDKIGLDGVQREVAEISSSKVTRDLMHILTTMASPGFEIQQVLELLPAPNVVALVAGLNEILEGVKTSTEGIDASLTFDGTLVRGMGYYSGPIFEVWHPSFSGAISGGGRYDNMIGRFIRDDVPGCGFSIGFERIVDLIGLEDDQTTRIAVLYEKSVSPVALMRIRETLLQSADACRLVPKPKRFSATLAALSEEGFTHWVTVDADGAHGDLRSLEDAT